MRRTPKYRLDVNYLSKDFDDSILAVSSPVYSLKEGLVEFKKAIKEKCIDDKSKNARVHLWEYQYTIKNELVKKTVAKNY